MTRDSDGYGLATHRSSSAFGPVGDVAPTYGPGHDTSIGQYHNQISTTIDGEQDVYSNSSRYFGFAPYGHLGPSHIDNRLQVPLPASRGRVHEVELDDFGQYLDPSPLDVILLC